MFISQNSKLWKNLIEKCEKIFECYRKLIENNEKILKIERKLPKIYIKKVLNR